VIEIDDCCRRVRAGETEKTNHRQKIHGCERGEDHEAAIAIELCCLERRACLEQVPGAQ